MQKMGWVYLTLYGCDIALAVIASFVEPLSPHSNTLSTIVILASIPVFILSIIQKLKPRFIFVLLSSFYLILSLLAGMVIGVLLAMKVGADGIPADITPQYLSTYFAWYWPVHWGSIFILCILLIVGIERFLNYEKGAAQMAATDR